MKIISISLMLGLLNTVLLNGQQEIPAAKNSMTVVFYNVASFYDPVNSEEPGDDGYVPGGSRKWDSEKYQAKINSVAEVLSGINEKELPAIIGLAEIENSKVLNDLASAGKLKKAEYGTVHFEGRTGNSLEAAILYDRDQVEILSSKAIPASLTRDEQEIPMDILYAKCRIKDNRTIHLFVNQWHDRTSSGQDSEMKRVSAALVLRREADMILNNERDAAILIMGDFSDEPTNRSLMQILNATNKRKNQHYRDFYNLFYDAHNTGDAGTTLLNNSLVMFDQIIVSPSMLKKGTDYYLSFTDGQVYRSEELLKKDQSTGLNSINSTFEGEVYKGGTSDHLPVYAILRRDSK
jgi:hypothetical protein